MLWNETQIEGVVQQFLERRSSYGLEQYRELHAKLESLKAIDRDAGVLLFRRICLADLWFFTRYVLSVGEARVEGRFLLDHQTAIDVSRIVQDLKHKELFIGAREHYKSTFLRARAVWRLCHDSNRVILILRATLKRAREVVQAIRDLIDKSPKLQVYWPEIWKG